MMSCPPCPNWAAKTILRVSFGLSLFLVGLAHYVQFQAFSLMVTDSLGPIAMLGSIWAYVLPALLVVGGGLFVTGRFNVLASWLCGVALASIPVGVLLKPVISGIGLEEAMPAATTTLIWLLVYAMVAKNCGSCSAEAKK